MWVYSVYSMHSIRQILLIRIRTFFKRVVNLHTDYSMDIAVWSTFIVTALIFLCVAASRITQV